MNNYWKTNEKILGVLGLSPYATFDFLSKIADNTDASKDWEHIRIIMDLNTKIPSRGRSLDLGEESPVKYIINSINNLKKNNVDLVVIPCNTAHIFFDEFKSKLNVKFLSIIHETCGFIYNYSEKIKRVGLIASKNTTKYKIYEDELNKYNISVEYYPKQDEITDIIENVKIGNYSDEVKLKALKISDYLIKKNCHGIILGCTEIPLVINENDLNIPIFDTNKILAMSCINYIRKKNE